MELDSCKSCNPNLKSYKPHLDPKKPRLSGFLILIPLFGGLRQAFVGIVGIGTGQLHTQVAVSLLASAVAVAAAGMFTSPRSTSLAIKP